MGVKCPKHHVDLVIEYTSINLVGNTYPVVTGQCPKCKVKFLSREIMTSSGSFKIAGQVYEYLNEMEIVYPHPFKPLLQHPVQPGSTVEDHVQEAIPTASTTNTKSETKKSQKGHLSKNNQKDYVSHSNSSKKQKSTSKHRSKETRRQALVKKKAEAQEAFEKKIRNLRSHTDPSKETGILDMRSRIRLGDYKEYHAKKVSYLSTIPSICLFDMERLDFVERVRIEKDGGTTMCEGWCCFRCNTVYLPLDRKSDLNVFFCTEATRSYK